MKLAFPFLGNSKSEVLKRESLLNTFADGGLNIIDIRTNSFFKLSSVLAGYTPYRVCRSAPPLPTLNVTALVHVRVIHSE